MKRGEVPLGREFDCRNCGESGIVNVWKNKQPVCPKCGFPDVILTPGGTHMLNRPIFWYRLQWWLSHLLLN
jgi:ribosomal protein S27AE